MNATSAWSGQHARLRAPEPTDWEPFWQASHDTESQRFGHEVGFPESVAGVRRRFEEEALVDGSTAARFMLVIESLSDGLPVGAINVHGLDRRNGTFEYGITVFREYRGRGFASEAIVLLLRYCFGELRLQKVNATVYAFNEPSLALHRSLGFVEEGRIRSNYFSAGEYHDEFWFGMTAAEFRGRHG